MNLIVDIGNTFVKLAIYKGTDLQHKKSVKHSELKEQYKILRVQFPKLKSAIIASVVRLPEAFVEMLKEDLDVIELSLETKLPFKSLYKTQKTLGVDRIALVSASVNRFPNRNVLIIDAGTCITYDFITAKNVYLGGAISPGIGLRYKSLNDYTANLPLLTINPPKTIIGNTTVSSIHSGVIYGVIKEMDGVIDQYQEKYSDLTVILTGGDSKFLSKQLKNSIFANLNFLLEGLNFILLYNCK